MAEEKPGLEQFCRALAAHVVMMTHPHFTTGVRATEEHIKTRLDRAARLIHTYALGGELDTNALLPNSPTYPTAGLKAAWPEERIVGASGDRTLQGVSKPLSEVK